MCLQVMLASSYFPTVGGLRWDTQTARDSATLCVDRKQFLVVDTDRSHCTLLKSYLLSGMIFEPGRRQIDAVLYEGIGSVIEVRSKAHRSTVVGPG